ncbi:MAG: RNA methyltransferase [Bacteroidales bacterium]|nr:RNA methyltransferase [Candidatus Liminaster caballi]
MEAISKNLIKQIRSLEQRKFRRQEGEFVAEGNKLVHDNLSAMHCHRLVATSDWWQANSNAQRMADECYTISPADMQRLSLMQSPQDVLATFSIPDRQLSSDVCDTLAQSLTVALDEVQDPGNLGTIIRLCDWFGIRNIICSPNTADCYAPKVVQATMGAIARVKVFYTPLPDFLSQMRQRQVPVYGTFLEGDNIYASPLSPSGIIVMGNEGRGISDEVRQTVSHKLFIPPYPADALTSESLNVGIATAITVSEFRRRCK